MMKIKSLRVTDQIRLIEPQLNFSVAKMVKLLGCQFIKVSFKRYYFRSKKYNYEKSQKMGKERKSYQKKESLHLLESLPILWDLYGLVKEKKSEGLIFNFWIFNGIIRMRELQDSRFYLSDISVILDLISYLLFTLIFYNPGHNILVTSQ